MQLVNPPHEREVGCRHWPGQVYRSAEQSGINAITFSCDSVEYWPHYVLSSAHFDCNCLRSRMKSSASRAAVITPAALYKAATK